MNKLFLSAAALLVILSSVLPYSIEEVDAKIAPKLKIYAVGQGVSASTPSDAPLNVRKQEAFIAAFFAGVRNIAEQALEPKSIAINESEDIKIYSFHKRIGTFGINSSTVIKIKEALLTEDRITVNYKGQKIVIKDGVLISPSVKSVKMQRWNRLPKKISGIKIKEAKWNDKEEIFTVKLAYRYTSVKAFASSKRFDGLIIDASGTGFKPALLYNRVITSWGEMIYDPDKMVSQKIIVEYGSGEYTDSLEKAKAALESRGVKNPLVIKAVGSISGSDTKGKILPMTTVVITEKDAIKILEADKDTGFLYEAKVGFVIK